MLLSRPTLATFSILAAAALLSACAAMTPPDREPTRAWNQEAVTRLAAQLEVGSEALYNSVRRAPETLEVGMENASGSMMDSARQIHEEAGELHANLEAGKGRAETLDNYRDIKELSRDIGESADFVDEDIGVGVRSTGMSQVLHELDAYYGAQ